MTREELFQMVELLRDTAKLHQPNEEILTDVKAESFIFVMDSVLSALSENKGDLISRQAVKDIILGGVSTDTDVDKEYVCGLIDNLSSAENKGEWISVSERSPEENSHVLVSVKGEPDFVATDDYFSYGFDDWKDDVTAWMPAPEPYKEGGE